MENIKVLEEELKKAKKNYRNMLEKLYSKEISQEEHDLHLSKYLKLTSKVRNLRNK